MKDLTPRQQQIYDWILAYFRRHLHGPTIREVQAGVGIKSPNGVVINLDALRRKGMITRRPNIVPLTYTCPHCGAAITPENV